MNHNDDDTFFIDLAINENEKDKVDVIIPILHVNRFFKKNLLSIYREIPINNLLIGDAGLNDHTKATLAEFPRVIIFDHKDFNSLGFSIKELVNKVTTRNFLYLHSDVYLTKNFYKNIKTGFEDADFIESDQNIYVEASYLLKNSEISRPYSGAQYGVTKSLKLALDTVDDDYLYRSEDIIIQILLEKKGFKYKKNRNAIHIHQVCDKLGANSRVIERVDIHVKCSESEDIRTNFNYFLSFIKYTNPKDLSPEIISSVINSKEWLIRNKVLTERAALLYLEINTVWIKYLFGNNINNSYKLSSIEKIYFSIRRYGLKETLKKIIKKIRSIL